MRNLRIGIDAMGGDFAPDAVVKGVVEAIPLLDEGSKVVLFGDKERIEELLKAEGYEGERVEIVATTEVITMHDHPAKAFQTKADSSIRAGFEHLAAKKIDGFASAGSTGAMMAGAIFTVGVAEGVIRPAISAAIANIRGGYTLLLDVINGDRSDQSSLQIRSCNCQLTILKLHEEILKDRKRTFIADNLTCGRQKRQKS